MCVCVCGIISVSVVAWRGVMADDGLILVVVAAAKIFAYKIFDPLTPAHCDIVSAV